MPENPGVEPGPGQFAPPERAPGSGACEGAGAAPCSELYKAPVPFQGRSLEGAPPRDGPNELARSLDAEMAVDDPLPVEPGPDVPDMKFVVACSPVIDTGGERAALVERRAAYAQSIRTIPGRRRDPVRAAAGGCARARAGQAASDHRAASVSANCIAPLSFGSDPRRITSLVDPETTSRPDEDAEAPNPSPDADPRDALDLSGAARRISGTREREPDRRTGFGQIANGWNECPFSSRERILNALSRDESVRPDWIAALGSLPSSPCRTMMPMSADASGARRHARGRMRSAHGRRLLQLIEMLDHAAVVV